MTHGERLYEAERRRAITLGTMLPTWCNLDAQERLRWIQRGASEQALTRTRQ